MGPQVIHLPDGQNFTVTPVFAGLFFKSHELNTHHNPFPIGWTVVLNTESEQDPDWEDDDTDATTDQDNKTARSSGANTPSDDPFDEPRSRSRTRLHHRRHVHSFTVPTLQSDNLFISSISNPSSTEFKPAASPTRQIAMMLWITLYWYFHQPAPAPQQRATAASRQTPLAARPRGDWRINVRRDGVLRGRNLIPKLERMGLLSTDESAVGTFVGGDGGDDGWWDRMFVSRRAFWQMPANLFLFTLQPNRARSSFPGSPAGSRPTSPARGSGTDSPHGSNSGIGGGGNHLLLGGAGASQTRLLEGSDLPGAPIPQTLVQMPSFPMGPFFSSSHLPTYYPPPPLSYVTSEDGGVRHPRRPRPPRMGEVFYTRFVPSVSQYLSFRVASLSPKPVPYLGPVGSRPPEQQHLTTLSDTSLLQMWLGNPRVKAFWGEYVPDFLTKALGCRHSFPVIGLWDGVPFGYFEVYWVKEDILGRHLGSEAGDFDRGLHVLVGEEWARGRVPVWMSSLVHWCWQNDYRTMGVCLEPRIDNARFIQGLQYIGFAKMKQIAFPHKQSWYCRMSRDAWEAPVL